MHHMYAYHTKFGKMMIVDDGEAITHLCIVEKVVKKDYIVEETSLIQEAAKEVNEYFDGERKSFEFPIAPQGTLFQQKVWQALQQIPYGETRNYKQIAEVIGQPKAARAVGMANNKNPILLAIPCHRVIGSNGQLIGFAGGLFMKETLLNLEQKIG